MTQSSDTLSGFSTVQNIDLQELAISIFAQGFNPSLLNLDMLRYSGIIPLDWELARDPVINPNQVQISFKNSISILAQGNSINFSEVINTQEKSELQMPNIVSQYIDKFPKAEYQGININPKNLVAFPNQQERTLRYITETLIAPGPWQKVGNTLPQATVNFAYQLEYSPLNINVTLARIQSAEQPAIPALLFAGNFSYALRQNDPVVRSQELLQCLSRWQTDVNTFREIVQKRFLASFQAENSGNTGVTDSDSIFPTQFTNLG